MGDLYATKDLIVGSNKLVPINLPFGDTYILNNSLGLDRYLFCGVYHFYALVYCVTYIAFIYSVIEQN